MNDVIALLTFDPQKRNILAIKIVKKQFKFKCKRQATLCCKLGGPMLTKNDVKKIQSVGYSLDDFLESPKTTLKNSSTMYGGLKTRPDGSCVFLNFDEAQNKQICNIYATRPALCRLYPFNFEFLGDNRIALKFIPCCMGLNNPEAKTLDEQFISSVLLGPLLDVMELEKTCHD